jgi:hypothetical protein
VLARYYGRTRIQAISVTTLVVFLDQVVVKGAWILRDSRVHPQLWGQVTLGGIAVNLMMSYILFAPVLLILAFLGTELNQTFKRK